MKNPYHASFLPSWLIFAALIILAMVFAAPARAGLTLLGHSPSGSMYTYVFDGAATSNYSRWWIYCQLPDGSEFVGPGNVINVTNNSSPYLGVMHNEGSFTVPVAVTWQFVFAAAQNGGSLSSTVTNLTGESGTYGGEGTTHFPGEKVKTPLEFLENKYNRPVVYEYRDKVTGEVYKRLTLAPGEQIYLKLDLPAEAHDVEIFMNLPQGASWVEPSTGAVFVAPSATFYKQGEIGSGDFQTTAPAWEAPVDNGTTPGIPLAHVTPGTSVVVPIAPGDGVKSAVIQKTDIARNIKFTDDVAGSGGASDKTFREASAATVAAVNRTTSAVEALKVSADKIGAFSDSSSAAAAMNPAAGVASGQGVTAGVAAKAIIGTAPTGKGYTMTTPGAPNLSVSFPVAFGGGTMDLNPFASDRLGPIASWFRAAVAWLTIVVLGVWVWKQMGEWIRGFSAVQQAKGNTIAAGTGGQATALIAAGLMTVAIVTGTTALVAWSFDEINLSAFISKLTTNPMTGIASGSYWMLDQVFPVATMVTACVARLSFSFYASGLFATCSAVVRFIVP